MKSSFFISNVKIYFQSDSKHLFIQIPDDTINLQHRKMKDSDVYNQQHRKSIHNLIILVWYSYVFVFCGVCYRNLLNEIACSNLNCSAPPLCSLLTVEQLPFLDKFKVMLFCHFSY